MRLLQSVNSSAVRVADLMDLLHEKTTKIRVRSHVMRRDGALLASSLLLNVVVCRCWRRKSGAMARSQLRCHDMPRRQCSSHREVPRKCRHHGHHQRPAGPAGPAGPALEEEAEHQHQGVLTKVRHRCAAILAYEALTSVRL